MASINATLSRLNAAKLLALSDLVLPKLNPAAPATPPVPNLASKVLTMNTVRLATKTANDAYEAARATLGGLKAARDAKVDLLRIEHNAMIAAIEAEAKGDPVMLGATGYTVSDGSAQASTLPSQIHNLVVTAGDLDGTVEVSFDPEENSKTYEVQITLVDPVAGPWTTKGQPAISSVTLAGLTSGTRVWVRARGIGSKGAGAWSDPATKIVP